MVNMKGGIMKIFIIMLLVIIPIAGKSIEVVSKIDRVTVYQDRANVVRKAEVELDAGVSEIIFSKLPLGIYEESIRISTHNKGIKILGISRKEVAVEKPISDRIRELEEKIQGLKDERKAYEDTINVLNNKEEFLKNLRASYSEKISKEMIGAKTFEVKDLKDMASFIEEELNDVFKKKRDTFVKIRELDKKIATLEFELKNISYQPTTKYNSIIVSVEAEKKGKYDIELNYVIGNASWYPLYDARVLSEEGKVELIYYGIVTQRTGEDWNDVEVALSTAKPAIAGRLPDLTPRYLSLIKPEEYPRIALEDKTRKKVEMYQLQQAGAKAVQEVAKEAKELVEKEANISEIMPLAETVESATQVLFKIKKRETIPSDGTGHKTTISVDIFPAEFEYESIPLLTRYAYLKSIITNADRPLLNGEMNIFLDKDYIGKSYLKFVAPNQKFSAYFGIDEGIKIQRKEEKKEESTSTGFLSTGMKKKFVYGYRIIVENYKKKDIKITLSERVPVSNHQDLKINIIKLEPEAKEKTKEGIIKWELTLKPNEKKELYFEYSLEYPEDKVPVSSEWKIFPTK
jgi:uncharacterized protein (TIGR02231 family)